MPSLGDVLRRLREDAGISRSALARTAGVDASVLTRLELGDRTSIRFETLCRVVESLNVSLDDVAAEAGLFKRRTPHSTATARADMVKLSEALKRIEDVAHEALERPSPKKRYKR